MLQTGRKFLILYLKNGCLTCGREIGGPPGGWVPWEEAGTKGWRAMVSRLMIQ